MAEPWDEKTSDERTADTVANFIIFFEDKVVEPHYFKSFAKPGKLKINDVPDQLQGNRHLQNAISRCIKDGLMVFKDGKYQLPESITENIWCVFDRDTEALDPAQVDLQNHVDFDTAIAYAKEIGLKVAWSNDVFELWLLLHFEDIESQPGRHRTYIYERLTEILKNVPNKPIVLEDIVKNARFEYKTSMKSRIHFATIMMPLLKENTQIAIGRSKILEASFGEDTPFHQRNPCTMVHHLIEEFYSALAN